MNLIPGTLRARVVVVIVLATLPGLLALAAFVWEEQARVVREAEQRALTALEVLVTNQNELVQRTKQFLQRLSAFDELQNPADPVCGRFLRQVLKLNGAYVNLGVPRPDGELLCNALPMEGVVNVADRGYFQRTLRSREFTIGEFQIDRAAKQASVNFSYPVMDPDNGRIRGVAVAVVSLDWWSRKLGEVDLPGGTVAVVTDANDTIIAHYPPNSRALGLFSETYGFAARQRAGVSGKSPRGERESAEFHAVAYASRALFSDSLNVRVSVPYSDLLATSRGYLWLGVATILFGVTLIVILMSWVVWVGVLRPLADLLAYTRSLESDSAPELPASQGVSELRTLREQFVSMGRSRLQAESQQRRSETRFRQIAETIQEVFWIVSPDWNQIIYINPAYEQVWQKGVETLYREPYSWLETIVPDDRQKVLDYLEQLKRERICDIQFPVFRIERKDGTRRWISAKGFPVRDETGGAINIVGIAEDVTERVQYEAELSEREAKYRLLVEYAEDLVVKVDTKGRFLFVSPSYCRTFGKSEHQLLGKAFMPLVHEDDQASSLEAMKLLYYPPFRAYVEQRAMTMRGWRWFGWSNTSVVVEDGEVTEIIGVGRDITEQKRVDFALRESESHYRELVDNMSDGVVVYRRPRGDGDFVIKELNRAAEKITRHKREHIVGKRAVEIFPGIRQLGLLEILESVSATGEPRHHPVRQYRDQRLNLWVENYVFRLPSGEVVAVFKDMTTEKRALLALQNSEEKFRSFFENLPVGLVIADTAGTTLEVNKSFSDILDIDRSEAAGRSLLDLLAPRGEQIGLDRIADVLEGREERRSFRFSDRRRNNRQITVDVSLGVLRGNSGARIFVYGIVEDMTALVEAEETRSTLQQELTRTHRLEALGRLAGGVAHDFNNILGAISEFIELARERLASSAEPQQIGEYLQHSKEGTERAKLLIRQLLLFSHGPEALMVTPQDFSRVVNDSLGMIRSFLPSTIALEVKCEGGPHWVNCDPAQIEQILVNLCISARDTMQGHGTIQVRVGAYDASGDRCEICSKPVLGRWVSLCVEDTGPAMPREIRERIFEPFFSTKEDEHGNGMGLSVVRGILSGCGGHVLISTGSGGGSCFRILFPYHRRERGSLGANGRDAERESVSPRRLAGVRVMIVDDEASMRQLIREVLTEVGCRVIECETGATALELLGEGGIKVDLLITDQTLPRFTGIDLVRELRQRGDRLPVILCSGRSEQITERLLRELEITHRLDKPVEIHDLLDAIRETLRDAKKQA